MQLPVRIQLTRDRLKGGANFIRGQVETAKVPLRPHQEKPRFCVDVLVSRYNIPIIMVNKFGDSGDQTLPVRARNQ